MKSNRNEEKDDKKNKKFFLSKLVLWAEKGISFIVLSIIYSLLLISAVIFWLAIPDFWLKLGLEALSIVGAIFFTLLSLGILLDQKTNSKKADNATRIRVLISAAAALCGLTSYLWSVFVV